MTRPTGHASVSRDPPDLAPDRFLNPNCQLHMHTDAIVVLTTVANDDEAVTLVRELLDRRLIACGTLVSGARSLYRWQGKIADEREVLLLLKTRSARLDALQEAFRELHPYKVPELLALSVDTGLEKYIEWISGETSLSLT